MEPRHQRVRLGAQVICRHFTAAVRLKQTTRAQNCTSAMKCQAAVITNYAYRSDGRARRTRLPFGSYKLAESAAPNAQMSSNLAAEVLGEPLDDRGVGLSAAFAHGLEPVPAASPLELVQHLRHQDRAGGSEWVA